LRVQAKQTSILGFGLLVLAFLVFLFYGNEAPGIVLLAIGVVFVAAGAKRKSAAPQ